MLRLSPIVYYSRLEDASIQQVLCLFTENATPCKALGMKRKKATVLLRSCLEMNKMMGIQACSRTSRWILSSCYLRPALPENQEHYSAKCLVPVSTRAWVSRWATDLRPWQTNRMSQIQSLTTTARREGPHFNGCSLHPQSNFKRSRRI